MGFFANFAANFAGTVIGGALLTFFFFFLKERVFPLPHVAGIWFFEEATQETDYTPYKGMILRYVAVIWREGTRLCGTVEKIYENSSTGERSYVGKYRTRGIINGYIQKNYFSKDKLFIHIAEDGEMRQSTNFHDLTVTSDDEMYGSYSSMVANQEGITHWQRSAF